jgi:adenosine kinase
MSKIIISGSIAYDRLMNFAGKFEEHLLAERLDNINVSFTVNTFTEGFGGTAGNIAYNLAHLAEKPTIIATAGNDFAKYDAWMASHGIDTSSIEIVSDVTTASAYITTDTTDNQIASFYLGAMVRPYERAVDATAETIAIISPGNNVDMVSLASSYATLGVRYLYDPGQQAIMLSREELQAGIQGANVLFANEYEMGVICERTGWAREELARHVPTIIITLAEKGTLIIQGTTETRISAVVVQNVVDPTGAGDAYRAGFIKGMIAQLGTKECVQLASTVAAYAVESKGTQNHSFTIQELKNRYQQSYSETLSL